MAGRGVARWVTGSAVFVLLGAGVAGLAGAATAAVSAGPRVHPVIAGVRPAHPDAPGAPAATGQECFFVFPACTSADPTVSFVMTSSGDSTGCTFQQDTTWGDGSDTNLTYNGGKPGTALVTFTHSYSAPGMYQIGYSISVTSGPSGKCGGGSNTLQFTLAAPAAVACQSSQQTVPGTTVSVPMNGKPVSLTYGSLALAFAPTPTSDGALCALPSAMAVESVDLNVPGATAPIPLGSSETTATIELFAASNVPTVPLCDFGPLETLTSPSTTPPLAAFARTNNCFLTPTFRAPWDVVARWTVPSGIAQLAHLASTNSDATIYSTQPLTYYVDLDTLPLPADFTGDAMGPLVNFIYSTLAENLPVLDRVALIQDAPPHVLVTNPFGRRIGLDVRNHTHAFAGTGYVEVGGRAIAWILEPVLGDYQVSVHAKAGSAFDVDVADLQFLGHGSSPLVENFTWPGKLGPAGFATKKFQVRGTALAPVLTPHESKTRVKPHAQIRFTLTGSVIPLGFGKVAWQFGDGTKANGRPTKHRYAKPGRYTPVVTVTDAVGYTVTVKLPVIVVKR